MARKIASILDDEGSGDEKEAAKRLADKVKQRAEEPRPDPESNEPIEVSIDEDDDEDDDPVDTGRRGPTRKEKKQNRYRQLMEERDADRARLQQLEQQNAQMQAYMQGLSQRQAPQPQQPEDDPLEREYQSILRDQKLLLQEHAAYGQNITAEQQADMERRAAQLEKRKLEWGGHMANRRAGIRPIPPEEAVKTQLMARFPDVMGNPQAQSYMVATFNRLRARGLPDSMETVEEAVAETRRDLRIGAAARAPAPSPGMRTKLAGASRGSGGGGGGGESSITMTKEYRAMADALYANIKDPMERYKKWARGPGRKLVEKQRS